LSSLNSHSCMALSISSLVSEPALATLLLAYTALTTARGTFPSAIVLMIDPGQDAVVKVW
jgi:hypothetical protein